MYFTEQLWWVVHAATLGHRLHSGASEEGPCLKRDCWCVHYIQGKHHEVDVVHPLGAKNWLDQHHKPSWCHETWTEARQVTGLQTHEMRLPLWGVISWYYWLTSNPKQHSKGPLEACTQLQTEWRTFCFHTGSFFIHNYRFRDENTTTGRRNAFVFPQAHEGLWD